MTLRLLQHAPAWDLPSVDPACIKIQAYLHLAAVEFEVESKGDHPDADYLPALEDSVHVALACDPGGLLGFVREVKQVDLDHPLPEARKADLEAYQALLDGPLHSAWLYSLWLEPDNVPLAAVAAAPGIPASLANVLASDRASRVTRSLGLTGNEQAKEERAEELYQKAGNAYHAFSQSLGASSFVLGDQPTSLDAALFAHLLCVLRAPLPTATLQSLLKRHANLVAYTDRLAADLFSRAAPEAGEGEMPVPPPNTRIYGALRRRWWGRRRKGSGAGRGEAEDAAAQQRRGNLYFLLGQLGLIAWQFLWTALEVQLVEEDEDEEEEAGEGHHGGDHEEDDD